MTCVSSLLWQEKRKCLHHDLTGDLEAGIGIRNVSSSGESVLCSDSLGEGGRGGAAEGEGA